MGLHQARSRSPTSRKMVPVFQERAKRLSDVLRDASDTNTDKIVEGKQHFVGIARRSRSGTTLVADIIRIPVQDIYSRATIDIIGVTTLGIDLRNLVTPDLKMDFLQCYRRMFDQDKLSALITFINMAIPIRGLLPFVKANTEFVEASQGLRKMLRQCIRDRIRDINDAEKRETRDLLSYMIEERLGRPRRAYRGRNLGTCELLGTPSKRGATDDV